MIVSISHPGVWELLAFGCSFVSGLCCSLVLLANKQGWDLKRKIKEELIFDKDDVALQRESSSVAQQVISFVSKQSTQITLKSSDAPFTKGIWKVGTGSLSKTMLHAGNIRRLTVEGFCHSRVLLGFGGLCIGALFGAIFSAEFTVFGGFTGMIIGWKLPHWALRQIVKRRKEDLENHLSEMLEVLALGLRSGLSFDRSFELYHSHFLTVLSRESAFAQQQWQMGLQTREDALRDLASTYDSGLFSRVIENIIRSLRFGSSLADSISSSALEARVLHKANKEEEVAKAPVKMLVPTAALILPAMLILVLGPVMLDMMQGF